MSDHILEKYVAARVLYYSLGTHLIRKPFEKNNNEMYERFRTAFNELKSAKSTIEVSISGSNFNEIIQNELELYKERIQKTRDVADRIYNLERTLAELKNNPLYFVFNERLDKLAAECDELALRLENIDEALRIEEQKEE